MNGHIAVSKEAVEQLVRVLRENPVLSQLADVYKSAVSMTDKEAYAVAVVLQFLSDWKDNPVEALATCRSVFEESCIWDPTIGSASFLEDN